MSTLSNEIERFIKAMMTDDGSPATVQRNELADRFNCAPSQINYVLTTRFSPDRGYVVESRRGGGGYIKVIRVRMDEHSYIKNVLDSMPDSGISERTMKRVTAGLAESGYIDASHARSIYAALCDKTLSVVCDGDRDRLRAHILRQILMSLIS